MVGAAEVGGGAAGVGVGEADARAAAVGVELAVLDDVSLGIAFSGDESDIAPTCQQFDASSRSAPQWPAEAVRRPAARRMRLTRLGMARRRGRDGIVTNKNG